MADALGDGETMNRLIHQAVWRDIIRFETALGSFVPGDTSGMMGRAALGISALPGRREDTVRPRTSTRSQ